MFPRGRMSGFQWERQHDSDQPRKAMERREGFDRVTNDRSDEKDQGGRDSGVSERKRRGHVPGESESRTRARLPRGRSLICYLK